MSEFIGFAYYAEIPSVFFNVQRVGPSTGMPTRTQQGDVMLTMTLLLMSGKTGRADEVLAALGLDPLAAHIHRTLITLALPEPKS